MPLGALEFARRDDQPHNERIRLKNETTMSASTTLGKNSRFKSGWIILLTSARS